MNNSKLNNIKTECEYLAEYLEKRNKLKLIKNENNSPDNHNK